MMPIERDTLIKSAEAVSLFCRLNINTKKNLPVRSSEMGLLILIVKNGQPVTSVMAADFFKVKKPMIAAMVSSLTKRGYIAKEQSQEDKRCFTLLPSEKTVELVEKTYSEYLKALELLRAQLGGDDFDKLIELIEKSNIILLEKKTNG